MSFNLLNRRLQFNDQKPTNPAIVEASLMYLDHCESRCQPTGRHLSEWDEKARSKLTKEEMATKTAALGLLNRWLLGDHDLIVNKGERLPTRAFAALEFLSHCHFGAAGNDWISCCETGLKEARELNAAERAVKSTSLELLRNWFTGEIELKVVADNHIRIGTNGATMQIKKKPNVDNY